MSDLDDIIKFKCFGMDLRRYKFTVNLKERTSISFCSCCFSKMSSETCQDLNFLCLQQFQSFCLQLHVSLKCEAIERNGKNLFHFFLHSIQYILYLFLNIKLDIEKLPFGGVNHNQLKVVVKNQAKNSKHAVF